VRRREFIALLSASVWSLAVARFSSHHTRAAKRGISDEWLVRRSQLVTAPSRGLAGVGGVAVEHLMRPLQPADERVRQLLGRRRECRVQLADHVAMQADGTPHLIALALQELHQDRLGGRIVKLRIAELLSADVIRRYLETLPTEQTGWLAGLRDPLITRVLALLHAAPAHSWTFEALAAQAATSRSVLAERFVHLIAQPPMQYLRQLRTQVASRLLAEDGAKVAAVAAAVGFELEAAFSRAFKRCMGVSPDDWRQQPPS
jgi:AraC-like DNA-binding protein